jgi:50S ribosomal protein L16 3-hydroxylase
MDRPLIVDRRFSSVRDLARVLVDEYWGQQPVVFRTPFGSTTMLGGVDDVIAALRVQRDEGEPCVAYIDGRRTPHEERQWVTPEDVSLRSYTERVQKDYQAKVITLLGGNLQASSERIWFSCARFLSALYELIGLPMNPTQLFLIAGVYESTPFGIHKDTDYAVTCILEGRKRYLMWPYELGQKRLGLSEDTRFKNKLLPGTDYSSLRDEAIVFEAGPGDVVYWPWDYWHVVEPIGGYSASLSLGSVLFASPSEWVATVCEEASKVLDCDAFTPGEQPGLGADRVQSVARTLADEAVRDVMREAWLNHRTRFGFTKPLPATASGRPFQPTDRLATPIPDLIAWLEHSGRILLSANGHGVSLDVSPQLANILTAFNAGVPLRVADLEARYCEDGAFDRRALHDVLDHLVKFRALGRCE